MTTPWTASIRLTENVISDPLSPRLFGNFMEHIGPSTDGGILAHLLANPTFERNPRLNERQANALLANGRLLTEFYLSGGSPDVFPPNWSPFCEATGFGVCALDDARAMGVPFPWAPMGLPGRVSASVGRIGGGLRLRGEQAPHSEGLEEAASGVKQGVFPPVGRVLGYHGMIYLRIAAEDDQAAGRLQVGFSRRLPKPGSPAGQVLASFTAEIRGSRWQPVDFRFALADGQAETGEPLDFFIRWLPAGDDDLLLDQVRLLPDDAVEDLFDPDVLQAVKDWLVPLLRWPGGNFVSLYHWRDGAGPLERRPARPNEAWGGWEHNWMGTAEFIRYCRLAGCEPQITVNTGTGTPEEAAAWVEYCNGSVETPMGALRASHGYPEPFNVRLWEVGNEIYGAWQGGYHGSDENALRFNEFAQAMLAVDPHIELIATGNQFDIAAPQPGLDHTTADRRWNQTLFANAAVPVDYLGLHCLPSNQAFLEKLSIKEAYEALVGQPDSWERVFFPAIQEQYEACQKKNPRLGEKPLKLAITEWGVLGPRGDRLPVVENYGEVVYAGVFLNMIMRCSRFIGAANTTALLHGGCIHKAGGRVFVDPQVPVLREYTRLAGGRVLETQVESPTFAVETAPDLGLPLRDLPYLDAVAVLLDDGRRVVCAVNRHMEKALPLRVNGAPAGEVSAQCLAHNGLLTDRARLGDDPQRFTVKPLAVQQDAGSVQLELPPASVTWITFAAA